MTTLVLLPGMDGTGVLLAPLRAALREVLSDVVVHQVVLPTTGKQDYAALAAVARAALPASGPLVLLAESFSGPIAVTLAAEAGSRVCAVVLSATFVRRPRPVLGACRAVVRLLPPLRLPQWLTSALLLGRFATPALRALVRDALARVPVPVLRERLHAVLGVDATPALAQLRVPVLWLRATHDRLVPASTARHAAAVCAMVDVVAVDAPHCLLQARPGEAAQRVAELLRRVRRPEA